MSKAYIFMTYSLYGVGGIQAYLSSKITYLEKNGWIVKVLYNTFPRSQGVYKNYSNYLRGGFPELRYAPFSLPKSAVEHSLRLMEKLLWDVRDCEPIYMESHDGPLSQWGELLASCIGAHHIFATMNEVYRGPGKCYEEKLDFYEYKYERGELCGFGTNRLFEGYREIADLDVRPFIYNESPVQDVKNSRAERIEKSDWNICYIGRFVKPYIPAILDGIRSFAAHHPDKKIQVIIVGSTQKRPGLVHQFLSNSPNVNVLEMGDLIPLPRVLYEKVDVVIAGSGSARCSAMEGALTILADPESCKATGLLGYDTVEPIYWDGKSQLMDFDEALERVLVEKIYEGKQFLYTEPSVEECCEQNLQAFRNASQTMEYYDAGKVCEGEKHVSRFLEYCGCRFICHLPNRMVLGIRKMIHNRMQRIKEDGA